MTRYTIDNISTLQSNFLDMQVKLMDNSKILNVKIYNQRKCVQKNIKSREKAQLSDLTPIFWGTTAGLWLISA